MQVVSAISFSDTQLKQARLSVLNSLHCDHDNQVLPSLFCAQDAPLKMDCLVKDQVLKSLHLVCITLRQQALQGHYAIAFSGLN